MERAQAERALLLTVAALAVVTAGVLIGLAPKGVQVGSGAPTTVERGLVLQEGGADLAAAYGVPYAAKRWPAAYGFAQIDRELDRAKATGVRLLVGWMWHNEAGNATPADWKRVCWGAAATDCGPDYADPAVQRAALQMVYALAARYDGHPQVAAVMANVGLDGERRFCKRPVAGDPCFDAYTAKGLTPTVWQRFVEQVVDAYATAFTQTPVLFHYSGFGFRASDVGRDAGYAVRKGLGLMSTGLYPAQCSGNSWGGVCNPVDPLLNDWQVPQAYPDTPLAMEQSLPYGMDQAAMAWLWAVTHGAWQVHAQRQTLEWSAGQEWREAVEYLLAHPEAAVWVAWEPTPERCAALGRPYYCPETGDWTRNATVVNAGAVAFHLTAAYHGWVARKGPVSLRTGVVGPCEVVVTLADGSRWTWRQADGQEVHVQTDEYVHRVEVRPSAWPSPTETQAPTTWPVSTPTERPPLTVSPTMWPAPTPTPTYTATPTPSYAPTPTYTATCTSTCTPGPVLGCRALRIRGRVGPFTVNLRVACE